MEEETLEIDEGNWEDEGYEGLCAKEEANERSAVDRWRFLAKEKRKRRLTEEEEEQFEDLKDYCPEEDLKEYCPDEY